MVVWYCGTVAALLSAMSWAFGTVMFDRIGKVVPYVGLTFLKGVFSLVLMALLLPLNGGLKPVDLPDFAILALSGVIGIAVGDSLFFKSLLYLGAKTQVVFFLLGQIFTMAISLLLLDELLAVWQYAGAAVLLSGVIVVTYGKKPGHPNKLRGVLCGLLSILCFSVSAVMVKVAVAETEVITATFYRMLFGTVFTLGYGMAAHHLPSWTAPLTNRRLLVTFALNVVVITYGGFLLSTIAIKLITVSLTSVLGATEPVFAIVLAFLINKETISLRDVIGTLLTIAGLLLIVYST